MDSFLLLLLYKHFDRLDSFMWISDQLVCCQFESIQIWNIRTSMNIYIVIKLMVIDLSNRIGLHISIYNHKFNKSSGFTTTDVGYSNRNPSTSIFKKNSQFTFFPFTRISMIAACGYFKMFCGANSFAKIYSNSSHQQKSQWIHEFIRPIKWNCSVKE